MDTVPAIEDQLHALQPICSAKRVSTGVTCGAPAVAVAEVHAIDECGPHARDGVPSRHPPGVYHLRASHGIPAQCLRCARGRPEGLAS
jgi:hypothetical protein